MFQGIKRFNKSDIVKIHSNALKLIEELGIRLDDAELLKKLKHFDTFVDLNNKTVKISKKVSLYFLERVPKNITFFAIDPKYDIKLGGRRVYRPISGCINLIDKDGKLRKPTASDIKDAARLIQGLDLMHFNSTALFPFDVRENLMDITAAKICFENCQKHTLVDTLSRDSFEAIIELATIISGSEDEFKKRPFFQIHFPAISPLVYDKNACENIKIATDYNIPVRVGSSPMSGANGPIKLAGNLLVMHADIIAGIIISQMLKEGSPVYYGCAPSIVDMKFGTLSWGAAEASKMSGYAAELANYCNLISSTCGFATDSKTGDQQAAIEKSMNLLLEALSGVDVLAGAGLLEGEQTFDLVQLIIDNEIAKYVENLLKDIKITRDTLCFDLIKKVGLGGNFMNTEETLNLYMQEHERTELLDRRSRGSWEKIKNKTITDKARETVNQMLTSTGNNVKLPGKVIDKLEILYEKFVKRNCKL